MPRKSAQSDPALAIEFWLTGFYTYRSQLFAPYKGIGVNVVSFHDPVIDGANMEDTDLYEWSRRPGFSIYCSQMLNPGEVIDQFYSFRNLNGTVVPLFDSNQRIAQFSTSSISTIISKTTTAQGYEQNVGSMMYFSDGAGADMQKWLSTAIFSTINPSSWGLAAPTTTPQIYNKGCWLPKTPYQVNNAIYDPNGNVEVVVAVFGAGISGNTEPLWPTTAASTINDGSVQWENMGQLSVWLPDQAYPIPVVVLDTNGNLELATTTSNNVTDWNSITAYTVGETVFFGGNFWTAVANNTNTPPNNGNTWVLSQNPITTGPTAPNWNKTVGGTTVDNSYTWTNLGPGLLVESFGTSYVYCYRTIYGHLTTASPISINTGAIFGPVAAAITSFQITGNVVTFQGVNNFIPGNVFTVQGLTSQVGQTLNGQAFIVIATGTSPTQFSAVFNSANTAVIIDSGSTLDLIATVTGVGTTSPLCNATATITATQVSGDIVTIYANNGGALLNFVPGLQVTFSGVTVASFLNGVQYQIANVDPLGMWIQVVFTAPGGTPNQAKTTDTGTITFNAVEVYRTSDGGGTYLFTGAVTNPSGSIIVTPYDSGPLVAGTGSDNGIPGTNPWTNPPGVTGTSTFASVHLLAPSGGGSTAFSVVQATQNIAASSAPGSIQLPAAFSVPVTAAHNIIVVTTTYDVNSFSVSDSQGNPYSLVAQETLPPDHGTVTTSVWQATGVAAGPTTVFLNVVTNSDNNNFYGLQAYECSGLTGVVDTSNVNNRNTGSGGGTTFATGSITTTNANDVIFSFLYNDMLTNSGNTASSPLGFTNPPSGSQVVFAANDGASFQQMATSYQVQSAITTANPTWGTPSQSKAIGITVAFELQVFSPSDGLIASHYPFAVPPGISISGIQVTIASDFSGAGGSCSVQLIKNGTLVGSPKFYTPTGVLTNFVLGGMNDLWGTSWAFSDFNSVYGVQIIASIANGGTSGTFRVQNVRTEVFGSTSTTGWVFNDFTPDGDLDILLVAPLNHLNDPPPGAPGSTVNISGTILAYWQSRIWMAVGNFVYFSAGQDCTNGVPEEAWPPSNRFQFAGPVLALVPTADGVGLLVYLADRVNAILGGPETISFYPTDALSNFGISNPNAIFRDGSIIGQFTTQSQYFEIIGGQKNEVGEHVADYLLANFPPASSYVTMHRNGLDVGVFVSNGSDQVLRYGTNIGAWSVPAFPVGGAGALRSIETAVGQYLLLLASPTASVSANTNFTNPTSGINTGLTGTAWSNPSNITAGNPALYADVSMPGTGATSQLLTASAYPLHIPESAFITGVEVSVTGKQSAAVVEVPFKIAPLNPAVGAETHTFNLGIGSNTTVTFGSSTDLWGMPWAIPFNVNALNFGFTIQATTVGNPSTGLLVIDGATGEALAQGSQINSFPMGTLTPVGSNDMAIIFATAINNANQYVNMLSWNPTGWTTESNVSSSIVPTCFFLNNVSTTQTPFLNGFGDVFDYYGNFFLFNSTTGCTISNLTVDGSLANGNNDVPFTSNVAAGDALVVSVQGTSTGTPSVASVTDSQGNTYVLINTQTITGDAFGFNRFISTYAAPASATGACTVHINLSNVSATAGTTMIEVSGVTVTPPTVDFSVAEVQVKVFYVNPANFIRARDLSNWADNATFGVFGNGQPYDDCFVTVGSITLSPLGAPMFPLQHVVGYFDAAGTMGAEGHPGTGASYPNVWILPNEVNDTQGIGFQQLPEALQEPPEGQNQPSGSLLALRWPVNMMNSANASQFVHHLQVKIEFEPENAPNTIKAISFKEYQD